MCDRSVFGSIIALRDRTNRKRKKKKNILVKSNTYSSLGIRNKTDGREIPVNFRPDVFVLGLFGQCSYNIHFIGITFFFLHNICVYFDSDQQPFDVLTAYRLYNYRFSFETLAPVINLILTRLLTSITLLVRIFTTKHLLLRKKKTINRFVPLFLINAHDTQTSL